MARVSCISASSFSSPGCGSRKGHPSPTRSSRHAQAGTTQPGRRDGELLALLQLLLTSVQITEVNEEGTCLVAWDNGNVHSCRVGLFQEFWLLGKMLSPQPRETDPSGSPGRLGPSRSW
eukprot:768730-Hanusia_phi.AAC.2